MAVIYNHRNFLASVLPDAIVLTIKKYTLKFLLSISLLLITEIFVAHDLARLIQRYMKVCSKTVPHMSFKSDGPTIHKVCNTVTLFLELLSK